MTDAALLPSKEVVAREWWARAVYGVYALLVFVTFDHIEDDAFIYFRVGAHLAEGHGYVFNTGGERIEVGSSITWQALIALAYLVRLDVIVFAKVAGVALGAATLRLLMGLSRSLIRSPLLQIAPAFLLAVTIPFYGWVQRGLETSLYVFSIVHLAHCLTNERRRSLWPWAAMLVCLSRSEGPIVLFGLAGFFWFEREAPRRHIRPVVSILLGLGVVALGRFLYFHDFVPHPFYLKIQEIPGAALSAVRLYLEATWTWLLLGVGVFGLLNRSTWDRTLVTLAVLNLPFLAWGLRTFALVEFNRHLVPALPLLYVVTIRGVDALSTRHAVLRKPLGVATVAFGAWLWLGAPAMSLSLHARENLFVADLRRMFESPGRHLRDLAYLVTGQTRSPIDPARYGSDGIAESWSYQLGEFIDQKYPPGVTIAFDQMGQCPWYSGLDVSFIDTWGLTYRATAFPTYNERIQQGGTAGITAYQKLSESVLRRFWPTPYRSWTREQVVDNLFVLQPHVIILTSFIVDRKGPDGAPLVDRSSVPGLLTADPRLRQLYVERVKWFVRIYERRDLAARMVWAPEEHTVPGIPGW